MKDEFLSSCNTKFQSQSNANFGIDGFVGLQLVIGMESKD